MVDSPARFQGQARLPRFAAPLRYDLRLRPDLAACTFSGAAAIAVAVSAPTRFLVLNAAELDGLVPTEVTQFEEDEILVLGFDRELKYVYNGESRNMAVTQFESADARRCFPCWDDPAVKAKFKLTLEVPSDLLALSNMPVVKETVNGPIKTVDYEESPLMSTYLVAIVVGLFDYIESSTSEGTKVRVYTQIGKTNQGKFALDVAMKSLDLYKDYFATPYPLPKLDMIAIPDFATGAMENYGLVTYRDTALLYDELLSSASSKQQVSYLAVDSLFPEWNNWTQFLDEMTSGLRLDALAESHPIEVEVNHASEIDAIFDSISYDKGASVIRMLQSYLGAEPFQKALASYIKKYAYSNAKTEDLWAVLEEESGEPIKDLMTTWTKQQGYPVIYAKINGHYLEVEQKTDKMHIREFTASRSYNGEKNMWIKLNIHQTGFYRVISLSTEWHLILAGIVEDSYALSVARMQTLTSLLRLLNAYHDESDYTVLSHVTSVCLSISKISVDATPDLNKDFNQLLIKLLLPAAMKLGWDPKDGESHLDVMLRSLLLIALVRLGHNETINEGVRRFYIFFEDRKTSLLQPDTRKAAYLAVMRTVSTSNRSSYDALLKIYRGTAEPEEKSRVLGSLSSSPDKDIVRNQDAYYILGGISIEGRGVAWTWLKFTSDEKAAEVSEFFADRIKPSFERTLRQSLESVRISARWIESIKSEASLGQVVQELLQGEA
ncbi:hypothetical protein HU200_035964 [Digitaria exilis]|uniref:Alpha-aminoacylpeptide hydrolase n=1 Tax=Digitaria exilis TaxID=1010633 RepID=A0A835BE68_9POAL|nr:hypothetical protein HU200_035964 [Digitaria exilis]